MINYLELGSAVAQTIWENKGAAAILAGYKVYEYAAAHPFIAAYLAYRGARAVYRSVVS